jgi:hypothetical protein
MRHVQDGVRMMQVTQLYNSKQRAHLKRSVAAAAAATHT